MRTLHTIKSSNQIKFPTNAKKAVDGFRRYNSPQLQIKLTLYRSRPYYYQLDFRTLTNPNWQRVGYWDKSYYQNLGFANRFTSSMLTEVVFI